MSKNHGLTLLEKWQFFDFLNFLFFSLERHFFVLECRKRHFPLPILPKKKSWRTAIFGPKPWVNLFVKMPIFNFLNFSFLKPRKAFFRSKILQNTFFWPILPKKRKLKKWPFLDQNHELTSLEKWQFFDFLKFLFL